MGEKRVISIIKKVTPAVVSILISKKVESLEQEIPGEFLFSLPDKNKKTKKRFKIPKILADHQGMINVGGGSGFIVDKNGLILTNKHVLDDPEAKYTAVLSDGKKFAAQILSRDPINDVAIIKISATNLPTIELGDSTKLELGQSVIAIGNALGVFRNTVSLGIISGLSRSIAARTSSKSPYQEMRGLIQTDAAINAGNSGGPLVDRNGLAIGINTALIFGAQSIGFAIPIEAARRDLEDVKKYGRVRRPLLGVRYFIIDENLKDKLKLPVNYGALIARESPHDFAVVPNSPAQKAGLKEGDIILTLNSQKIDNDHTIQDLLDNMAPGQKAILVVIRKQKKFNIEVNLAERK